MPDAVARAWDKPEKPYYVPLREDYPKEELEKWDRWFYPHLMKSIWPYFDISNPEACSGLRKLLINYPHAGCHHMLAAKISLARSASSMEPPLQNAWWPKPKECGAPRVGNLKPNKNGVLVELKPVSGVFEASNVLVTRAVGEIDAPAQATFDMLVSPAGYAVIDPISKPEDHELPPLETYDWRECSRLEAAIATTNLPMMAVSEFVVLNAIDPNTRIFASKSIIHDGCPGGSKYSNEPAVPGGRERALNTFAIKIESISEQRCRVFCINYADMAGNTGALINNMINTKFFLPPLYKRIAKAMLA